MKEIFAEETQQNDTLVSLLLYRDSMKRHGYDVFRDRDLYIHRVAEHLKSLDLNDADIPTHVITLMCEFDSRTRSRRQSVRNREALRYMDELVSKAAAAVRIRWNTRRSRYLRLAYEDRNGIQNQEGRRG